MLKELAALERASVHGPIPPHRFWGYYTGPEIAELARADPNATAVLNVGAVEQHGPHLPVITDTLCGLHVLGAALARLPADVVVLALPATNLGKSEEHRDFPGTLSYRAETLRMVLLDTAMSVARSGFQKLLLLCSHGGNVGLIDDCFRDLPARPLQGLEDDDCAHSEQSAASFGGDWCDYLLAHQELNRVREILPDGRHQRLLHNAWGVTLLLRLFGTTLTRPSDGVDVSLRPVLEEHIRRDLGRIPLLHECAEGIELERWMYQAARPLSQAM